MTEEYIYVVSADYAGGLSLNIHFSDGLERVVVFSDFFVRHPHPQHDK